MNMTQCFLETASVYISMLREYSIKLSPYNKHIGAKAFCYINLQLKRTDTGQGVLLSLKIGGGWRAEYVKGVGGM